MISSLMNFLLFCLISFLSPIIIIGILNLNKIFPKVTRKASRGIAGFFTFILIIIGIFLLLDVDDFGVLETYIMTSSMLLIASIFIAYTYIKERIASLLTLSIITGGIGGMVTYFQEEVNYHYLDWLPEPFNTDQFIQQFTIYISSIFFVILYILLYLFFEQLYNPTGSPNRIRLSLIIIFTGATLAAGWVTTVLNAMEPFSETISVSTDFLINIDQLWDATYALAGLVTFIFGAFVYLKSYAITKEKRSLIFSLSMMTVSLVLIIGMLADLNLLIEELLFISDYRGLFFTIPLMVLVFVYLYDLDFIYRLPYNVYAILFFDRNSGLTVYGASYKMLKEGYIDDQLTTGTIVALNAFIKESLGQKENLDKLLTTDKTISFSTSESFMAAIIADKDTYFLKRSLDVTLKQFEIKYAEKIQGVINTSEFSSAKKIIERNFPYLVFVKQIEA